MKKEDIPHPLSILMLMSGFAVACVGHPVIGVLLLFLAPAMGPLFSD